MPRHWLLKTEPGCYSIDDLARDGRTGWGGIRNYQARNLLRDQMAAGDPVLVHHSGADPPGVAGVGRVDGPAEPDPTQFDPGDDHFDPKAARDRPIWYQVPLAFVAKFARLVPLAELKADADLAGLVLLQRGSRLSVQPVSPEHFARIVELAAKGPAS